MFRFLFRNIFLITHSNGFKFFDYEAKPITPHAIRLPECPVIEESGYPPRPKSS